MEKDIHDIQDDTQQTLDPIISEVHEVVVPSGSPSETKVARIITRLTNEQREVLEKYYNQGMKSKSKETRSLQHAAAEESELPHHIILVRVHTYILII